MANFDARSKGQPMPYHMPRAEFLAQRYCHPKCEVNLTVASLLARMGMIDLYNVNPIQENTDAANDITVLRNEVEANRKALIEITARLPIQDAAQKIFTELTSRVLTVEANQSNLAEFKSRLAALESLVPALAS